jgi:hypothetical protein
MMTMRTHRATGNKSLLILVLSLLAASSSSRAGSVDHYNPGVMNIRDFLMPEPGFYGVLYNYFYTSDRLNDKNGNQIKSVNINPGPGPGVTVNVNPSLDLYALAPTLIWISPWNLGGLKYGAVITPTFANSSIDAEVSTLRGRGINASTSTFDAGDMFVEPVWLGYTLTNWDFALGYGFYAPVGRYNTETFNLPVVGPITTTSPSNIGMGFWTHQIQGATSWYPWADRRLAIVVALTYQINSGKQGIDVTPGQHLTFNWGISQYLPLSKDNKLLMEVGPAGYDDWQITDDTGSAVRDGSVHDQVHAVGGQLGLTYVPWNAALNVHAFYEFSAISRVQGEAFGLSLAIKF